MGKSKRAKAEEAHPGIKWTDPERITDGQEDAGHCRRMLPKELVKLAPDVCLPSGNNPRENVGKSPGFAELVASVKASGVIVPVHVRPHPDNEYTKGGYVILAGERRVLAARKAKRKTLPAIVHHGLTDEEAFEVTFVENFQRQDLTPLEQGRAAEIMLERYTRDGKTDAKAAASKLGWSTGKLRRCARLTKLTPDWRSRAGEAHGDFESWTTAHLELIARYDPDVQARLLKVLEKDYNVTRLSVTDLERRLADEMRLLRKAKWPLEDATLSKKAGACLLCEKRSSAQPSLFDMAQGDKLLSDFTEVPKDDRCTDAKCWTRKQAAWLKRRRLELAEKHGAPLIEISTRYGGGRNILSTYEYSRTKKNDPAAVLALVVKGSDVGALRYVKLTSQGKAALKEAGKAHAEKDPSELEVYKDLKAKALREREIELTKLAGAAFKKAKRAKLGSTDADRHRVVVGVMLAFWDYHRPPLGRLQKYIALPPKEQTRLLWTKVRERLYRSLTVPAWTRAGKRSVAEEVRAARFACELIGVDFKALEAKAAKTIPLPEKPKKAKPKKAAAKKPANKAKAKSKARKKKAG